MPVGPSPIVGTATLSRLAPVAESASEVLVPLFAVHSGPLGLNARPHGLTRALSVTAARPDTLDTMSNSRYPVLVHEVMLLSAPGVSQAYPTDVGSSRAAVIRSGEMLRR